MEKIKRLLLYAGATPEEFAQVQQEMHLYNYNRLVAFLAISIIFLLISAVYAVFSVVLAPNLPAYLIVLGISCLLLPITLYVGRRSRAGLQICLSLFLSSLYSLSIYLSTVTSPGGPATAFIAFLLTLPTLFIMPLSAGQPARLRRCAWKICSASRRPVCIRQRAPTIRIKISCPAAADLPLSPCFLPSFLL